MHPRDPSDQAARMWKPHRQWFGSHKESTVGIRYFQVFVEDSRCDDATLESFSASKVCSRGAKQRRQTWSLLSMGRNFQVRVGVVR
jgi:hypothetical protein